MAVPPSREPPNDIHLDLEEALELLAALEEARDALLTADHLAEGVPNSSPVSPQT